jgi:hypothetical protein
MPEKEHHCTENPKERSRRKTAESQQGDRVSLAPLDPEQALRGLLAVDPNSKPDPQRKRRKKAPKQGS